MKSVINKRGIRPIYRSLWLVGFTAMAGAVSAEPTGGQLGGALEKDFDNWFAQASATQTEQPHGITPVAAVIPRLEQELRYDQFWKSLPDGRRLDNVGAGKGLELIPAEPVEISIGVPAWETGNTTPRKSGWGDESFLVKYRLLLANEKHGNYIMTAFLGLSFARGSEDFSSHHYSRPPTIAFGKGWGGTLGIGYQVVATDFPLLSRNFILSGRIPF